MITPTPRINLATTTYGMSKRLVIVLTGLAPVFFEVMWFSLRDVYYVIANFLLPHRPTGRVVPPGRAGRSGIWPGYAVPNRDSDSRSPCPGLNALANHNVLPRNGKRVTYQQMSKAIQHAYNLAPSLADQLTSSAKILDQGRGWINLHDLNALNVVQHDASFTRPDVAFCPDQSYPHPGLVDNLLTHATNGKRLSREDLAYFSALRRSESKRTNGQSSLQWSFLHKFFGSGNSALIYSIFGGNVKDLRVWLAEERFPDGWEPRNKEAMGHTIMQAQITSLAIEFNTNEQQKLRRMDALFIET